LIEVVSAEALVVPYKQADLGFKVGGRLLEMLVSEGDTVTAGQELARLDARDLQLAVDRAEAALESAQAQLDKAKAGARSEEVILAEADVSIAQGNLASAQATLSSAQAALNKALAGPTDIAIQIAEKQVELAKNQLWGAQSQRDVIGDQVNDFPPRASDVEYQAAQSQVAQAEAQVQIAELQLQQLKAGAGPEDIASARAQVVQAEAVVDIAEAQLDQAEAQLDMVKAGSRTEDIAVLQAAVSQAGVGLQEVQNALQDAVLTAPFDGVVGAVLFEEGEFVTPQMPVVLVGDLSRMRVETLDLSEADVNRVQIGQQATVIVDALNGRAIPGTVARIASVATERRGDRVYTVTIDLNVGPESGLRWGMSAFVEIAVK
jgi:multidrug efflux pump subunit AcrA (membrane-fusion protein)